MNILKIFQARLNRLLHPKREVIDRFHCQYYYSKKWADTYWMGKHVFKCPLDLWVFQEIIFDLKPDLIIETGTYYGGSALFFAHILDIIGKGEVVTIDVDKMPDLPFHPRIKYLEGSSISDEIVAEIENLSADKKTVIVFLDSDHKKKHVIRELELYNKFVTPGSYLIVEDSNLNGHPVYTGFGIGPGPMEAIEEFLPSHPEFQIDKSKEKFLLTFNPNGFLKRMSA